MTREEIRDLEEAGHEEMADVVGLPVDRVEIDHLGGRVVYRPFADTAENQVKFMMATLGGLIEADDVPEWPIDPYTAGEMHFHDFAVLRASADRLDLDEAGWRKLLIAAFRISSGRDYIRRVQSRAISYTGGALWTWT